MIHAVNRLLETQPCKFPILVEPVAKQRLPCSQRRASAHDCGKNHEDEAVSRLKEMVDTRLKNGGRLLGMDIPDAENPWLRGAGMFKDDPLVDLWQQAIAEIGGN